MAAAVPVLANVFLPGSGLLIALAFQVTGINDKINKAAANVFGEDLVKIGNIAAIAYGAYDSGLFSGESAASTAEGLSAADVAGGLDPAFGSTEAYNAATNLGGAEALANTSLGSTLEAVAPGLEAAEGTSGGFNLKSIADGAKATTQVTPAAASAQAVGEGQLIGIKPTVSAPGASLNGATASKATGDMYSLNGGTSMKAAAANATGSQGVSTSFLQRLKDTATSPVVMGNMIQGAAGGYASAAAQEAQREMYEKQLADRRRLASIGSAGYRVKG